MFSRRIYNYPGNSEEEQQNYEETINVIADVIARGNMAGKKLLIITGLGISSNVPNMDDIMSFLIKTIEKQTVSWSPQFKLLIDNYNNGNNKTEKFDLQAQLLTYIQNAYLGKNDYVQDMDQEPLKSIWKKFIYWLLIGDKDENSLGKKYNGLLKAEFTVHHRAIVELYKAISTISITTNFDNLLAKTFKDTYSDSSFYPLLEKKDTDSYYCSNKDDKSFIEIQSRGDVFWVKCSGNKRKICPNCNVRCYVPDSKTISVNETSNQIICNLCESDAEVYFAFPGTKEKDEEMSSVMDGFWKYLGNSISTIIIIGSSMDYDPILLQFLKEMIQKRCLPVLYISRYKEESGVKPTEVNEAEDIETKTVPRVLLGNYDEKMLHVWARAKQTEIILQNVLKAISKKQLLYQKVLYSREEINEQKDANDNLINDIFDTTPLTRKSLTFSGFTSEVFKALQKNKYFTRMERFSQLGLKTYWLDEKGENYYAHNRWKHSIGVMAIATELYLVIKGDKACKQELEFLRTATLLHDIGHLPFSHLLEEVFDEFGWIPFGEYESFNHEQYTATIIDHMYQKDDAFKKLLEGLHYTKEDLIHLINGEFGVGYLDALVNSPCDCDKIEYLHSDAIFMHKQGITELKNFLQEFSMNLSINPENFLVLEGSTTKAFLHLLQMRGEMYENVYLRSGLRYLEACCKMIIRIFIVYKCANMESLRKIENWSMVRDYYNLSDRKIDMMIEFMEQCLNDLEIDDITREDTKSKIPKEISEVYILGKMVDDIKNNLLISPEMRTAVQLAYSKIKDTKGSSAVENIENKYVTTYMVDGIKVNREKLKDLLKTLYLRFPGTILVDFVESKTSFSFGVREKRRRRSDGTHSATENILIKDITRNRFKKSEEYCCLGDVVKNVNEELNYTNHSYINIFRITENRFKYMQAIDYVTYELKKEGILENV